MKQVKIWTLAVAIGAVLPGLASAQISVTPQIGGYIPGGSFRELQDAAESSWERGSTLGLGANVTLGMLRGSLAYATGANISREGIDGRENVGDGSVLAGAVDVVLRPLPKLILLQPYVLGGAGYKRENYSVRDEGFPDQLKSSDNDFVLHVGAGLDLGLGPINLNAEITDFIGKNNQDKWKVHDAFAFVGVRLGLF